MRRPAKAAQLAKLQNDPSAYAASSRRDEGCEEFDVELVKLKDKLARYKNEPTAQAAKRKEVDDVGGPRRKLTSIGRQLSSANERLTASERL